MKSLVDRLRDRCRVEPATGCWVWQQSMAGGNQPIVEIAELGGSSRSVRRLVYLVACGMLNSHRVVTTTCQEERCINPAHLRAISRSDLNRKIARTRVASGPPRKSDPTWPTAAGLMSRSSAGDAGGSSSRPSMPDLQATSAYAAGSSMASVTGREKPLPIRPDGSCGITSGRGAD